MTYQKSYFALFLQRIYKNLFNIEEVVKVSIFFFFDKSWGNRRYVKLKLLVIHKQIFIEPGLIVAIFGLNASNCGIASSDSEKISPLKVSLGGLHVPLKLSGNLKLFSRKTYFKSSRTKIKIIHLMVRHKISMF